MNTKFFGKFVRITQLLVIVAMVFSVTGGASAAQRTLPGDWDGVAVMKASVLREDSGFKMWYDGVGSGDQTQVGLATSEDGTSWVKYSENPVLVGGPESWDSSGEHAPFVMKDGDQYKMWYEGSGGAVRQLGYATSPDGITWTKYEGNPVLQAGPEPYDASAAAHGTVLHDGDLYKLWYHAGGNLGYIIAYATSPNGIEWEKAGPVLVRETGAWDENALWGPSVLKVDGTYWMWYAGAGPNNPTMIGAATSTNGINWERKGSVITFADGNLGDPHVVQDGAVFKMWFNNYSDGKIYYADSTDGLNWGNFSPVLTPGVMSPLEGWHDGSEGDVDQWSCVAAGWVVDPDDRNRDVQVRILSDGLEVATGLASDYGQDMDDSGICPGGTCRFTINLWNLISADEAHQITVQAFDVETDDWWNLEGTPKSLTCLTPPPPNPTIMANPSGHWVYGFGWPLGTELTLTIGDYSATSTTIIAPWDPNTVEAYFDLTGKVDLVPGTVVTTEGDGTTKDLTITNFSVTGLDVATDTLSGTSSAQGNVFACADNAPGGCRGATAEGGLWTIGSAEGAFVLAPGVYGWAAETDEDGDTTRMDWRVPNPRFDVRANADQVQAWEWKMGDALTLTINGNVYPDQVVVAPTPWGDPQSYAEFNVREKDIDIKSGDELTLSNGTTTKTTIVTDLAITGFNVDDDTVMGNAVTGTPVNLWACDSTGCYNRHVTAQDGTWVANFSQYGDLDDEQNTVNIAADVWVDSQQGDDDGDTTMYGWNVPRFVVFPEWEWFDGLGWPDGHTVTITVAGKPECGATPVSWGGFFNGSFGDQCNVVAGDRVNFTDGITTSTHTVQNLAISSAKADTDQVTGTADPGALVTVWPHGHDQIATLQPTANAGGTWTADFTTVGFNLVPGINGRSEVRDDSGNSTAVDWLVPVTGWKQVNDSGFGDNQTTAVTSLEVFQGQLFAGTFNGNAGGQVWRQGTKGQWSKVSDAGFGSGIGNNAILDLVVFQGQLYAGTGWSGAPGQVWRTADGKKWQAVTTDGFGSPGNIGVTAFIVFKDVLYAGTERADGSAQIWRSNTGRSGSWKQVAPDGPGLIGNVAAFAVYKNQLYAAVESQRDTQMQVWRSANGSDWTTVVPAGFGFEKSKFTGGFVQFGGYLYIGTYNEDTGGQLWRTNDGLHWKQVVGDGFGDPNNQEIQALRVYNGVFYASTVNPALGMQLWRSSDGVKWVQVIANGFGDNGNVLSLWGSANIEYQQRIYIGTMNNNEGGELWSSISVENSQAELTTKARQKPGVSTTSIQSYPNAATAVHPVYFHITSGVHPDDAARYRGMLYRAMQFEYRARYPAGQYDRPHPPGY